VLGPVVGGGAGDGRDRADHQQHLLGVADVADLVAVALDTVGILADRPAVAAVGEVVERDHRRDRAARDDRVRQHLLDRLARQMIRGDEHHERDPHALAPPAATPLSAVHGALDRHAASLAHQPAGSALRTKITRVR
jgi:hypothetical protein